MSEGAMSEGAMSEGAMSEEAWEKAPATARQRSAAIVCESTACLPNDLLARYGITVVPIPFVFGTETYRDGVDITPAEFYTRLLATGAVPKTSPPSPGEYLAAWEHAARSAPAVISVTVDSKISTLQRSALLARELAPELLPGVHVRIVDSLSAGMGQGFVTLAAARAAAAGQPMEEIVAIARRMAGRVRMIVTLDTLEYLAKTSRIPQVAAILGGLLAIKPIIQISNGDIHPIARVRTRRRAIEALIARMRGMVPATARLHVAVQHARAAEEAAWIEAHILATCDCAEIYTTEFTPVMGGYCGPGLLGLAFYAEDEVEEEVVEGERARV
ncbi:MAG: DegV family protein [Ktedonobacterales bacterium]|nr:DegV family protein [Ktedonobacterales bacterium]